MLLTFSAVLGSLPLALHSNSFSVTAVFNCCHGLSSLTSLMPINTLNSLVELKSPNTESKWSIFDFE